MQSVEGIKKINASYQNFCHKESFVFLAKSLYEINSCGQARFFFGNFHTYIYEHSLVELALTNLRGNSVWWYQGLNVQTISVCRRIYYIYIYPKFKYKQSISEHAFWLCFLAMLGKAWLSLNSQLEFCYTPWRIFVKGYFSWQTKVIKV